MRKQWMKSGAMALVLVCCGSVAAQAPTQPAPEELDTVLVLGEQPGPGLWKVSKDDNVMWVLGTYGPLPQGVTWRSTQVEARIAESQQVLFPGGGGIGVDIGILHGLTLVPSAFRAGKIPDGKTLKDVLPPETYAKWLALRLKHIGKDDDVERWRPAIALEILREKAQNNRNRPGVAPGPQAVVRNAARQHKVPVLQLKYHHKTLHVEKPRSMLKTARKLDLPDLECFAREIERIEIAERPEAAMANAWARGDIETLRRLHGGPRAEPGSPAGMGCVMMIMNGITESESAGGKRAKKLFDDMKWHAAQSEAQGRRDWIDAAKVALAKNASTFAVLPIHEAIRPDGYLAALRDQGYEVEEPL